MLPYFTPLKSEKFETSQSSGDLGGPSDVWQWRGGRTRIWLWLVTSTLGICGGDVNNLVLNRAGGQDSGQGHECLSRGHITYSVANTWSSCGMLVDDRNSFTASILPNADEPVARFLHDWRIVNTTPAPPVISHPELGLGQALLNPIHRAAPASGLVGSGTVARFPPDTP